MHRLNIFPGDPNCNSARKNAHFPQLDLVKPHPPEGQISQVCLECPVLATALDQNAKSFLEIPPERYIAK